MKQSLPGLFKNAERALRTSKDDLACMCAFSLGELVDNLRVLKSGECTVEQFFDVYVFDSRERKLAEQVQAKNFLCMRDETEDEDAA